MTPADEEKRQEFIRGIPVLWASLEGTNKEKDDKITELGRAARCPGEAQSFLERNNPDRKARARERLRSRYQHEGIVEKMEEKRTRKDAPYWVLSIAGKRYPIFDFSEGKTISPGDNVFFNLDDDPTWGESIDDFSRDPLLARPAPLSSPDNWKSIGSGPDKPAPVDPGASLVVIPEVLPSVRPSRKTKVWTRQEKLDYAITEKGALLADRGWSYALGIPQDEEATFRVIFGRPTHRTRWIKLALADAIYKPGSGRVSMFESGEEFEMAGKRLALLPPEEKRRTTYYLTRTDHDIRTSLMKPRWSSDEIFHLMQEGAREHYEFIGFRGLRIIDGKGEESWARWGGEGNIYSFTWTQDPRSGDRTYQICLPYPVGTVFVNNVISGAFSLLPREEFFDLNGGEQDLIWGMVWRGDEAMFTLEQGARIIGWGQESISRHPARAKERLERVMSGLVKKGWSGGWERIPRDKNKPSDPWGHYILHIKSSFRALLKSTRGGGKS